MSASQVYINKIEVAHPPREVHQLVKDYLNRFIPPDSELGSLLARVLLKLDIEKRYSVLDCPFDFKNPELGFYSAEKSPTTKDRMRVYAEKALPLASLAVEPLLAGEDRQSITHLILTSCTGFYAPGLDIDIAQRFGLRKDVSRTIIGFMGCYAAVPGLKQAYHIVRSEPSAKVLMVNAEICTLHFNVNAPMDQQVSFLLFADGAAASLISAKSEGVRLDSFYTAVTPDTLDLMRWTISDDGFFMNLDPKIPAALKEAIHQEGAQILGGISAQDIASWAVHPGGRAILDTVERELVLGDKSLRHSRNVLKNYGNMSSPTIMFVLKEILKDKSARGKGCGMAFGPGLTTESFLYST